MAKRSNNIKRMKGPAIFDLLNRPTKKEAEKIKELWIEYGNEEELLKFEIYLHSVEQYKSSLKQFLMVTRN